MLHRDSPPVPLRRRVCLAASLLAWACGGSVSPSDTFSTEPDDASALPPEVSPETEHSDTPAIGGPWLGSFEAGLDSQEQLWLLPVSGAPVSVMPSNDAPPGPVPRSSYGYEDTMGYIAQTVLDAAHGRLIVASRSTSAASVRWLDLATGEWTALPLRGTASLHDTEYGAVILSRETAPEGVVTVMAAVDAEFETVAELQPEQGVGDVMRYRFGAADRIFLAGSTYDSAPQVGHYERTASGWRPVESPIPSGTPLSWVAASSDGTRLCALSDDQSAWLITADSATEFGLPLPSARCSFSPDGSRAVFTRWSGIGTFVVTDLNGAPLATFERLFLEAHRAPFSYGSSGKNLVRLDWGSLELEVLPSPVWCRGNEDFNTGVAHRVQLLESVAVVEGSCSCVDCHHSGVYLLPLNDGATAEPLILPREWEILQIGRLTDGSALIAQHPWLPGTTFPSEGDRFLRVSPDGQVTELGPFAGLPLPLHAPIGVAAR
jgi:hypothetical protein